MRSLAKRLASVAAILLVMSSGAYARGGDHGGGGGGNHGDHSDRGDRGRTNDRDFIWLNPGHENGCAVGNTPPPGANCTGRNNNN